MWKKNLLIIFLFYFFTLLQSSFSARFLLTGATPNLVFALFFVLVFFEKINPAARAGVNYQIIFLASVAGFFLDIFSYSYLGPSIILLIIIGFLAKKAQALLKNTADNRPLVYFLPLFAIFFLAYNFSLDACLFFLDSSRIPVNLGAEIIFSLVYDLFSAAVIFYIYKKILALAGAKQISLHV